MHANHGFCENHIINVSMAYSNLDTKYSKQMLLEYSLQVVCTKFGSNKQFSHLNMHAYVKVLSMHIASKSYPKSQGNLSTHTFYFASLLL
jgi:hypothetical protein